MSLRLVAEDPYNGASLAIPLFSGEPPSGLFVGGKNMTQQEIKEFARAVAKAIRTSAEARRAVWDCACGCPNLVVEF